MSRRLRPDRSADQCFGKLPHKTRQRALSAARRTAKIARARPGYGMQVYRCGVCHHWHVGSVKLVMEASALGYRLAVVPRGEGR